MTHTGDTCGTVGGVPPCLLFLLLLLLPVSCSLDDSRDLCCGGGTVRFRYQHRGADRFAEYIDSTRYFLFDGSGRFIGGMAPVEHCPAMVDISGLEAGRYTLVCVGNLDDYGTPAGHTGVGLEAFRLGVDDWFDGAGTFANGDRLYWGECHFTVVPGAANSFTGEMSNVHCMLRVRVEWERLPEHKDGYRYRLDGIGRGMELHGGHASVAGAHAFPRVEDCTGSMLEDVPLRRRALEASLYTLRWGKEDIPRFRLCHGMDAVTKEIDLGKIFRQWGWYPERAPVQDYRIRLLIRADGTIEVSQGLEAGVGDWEDGGTIG